MADTDTPKFTLGNAAFHYARTGGPKGFTWKFALLYGLLAFLVQAATLPLLLPMYMVSFNPETMNNPDAVNAAMVESLGPIMLGYAITMIGGLGLWVVFQAASLRRFVRGDGFKLRIGADEGRLIVVSLCWFVVFMVGYVMMIVAMLLMLMPMLFIGSGDVGGAMAIAIGVIAVVLIAVLFCAVIWVCTRFSPAAAMTIRDRKIQFFAAWRLTKGKVWTLIGAGIVLMLLYLVMMIVGYLIVGGTGAALLWPLISADAPGAAYLDAVKQPQFYVPMAVLVFVFFAAMGAFLHIFNGPAALVARTDPDWTVNPDIASKFN